MMYLDVNGRLGADSELRTSKSGKQYVSMRVATNDYIGGENVTTWVNVMWVGERAIKMQEHLKKGSSVIVRGTPRVTLYTTKEGEKAISFDVFADRVDFSSSGSGATQSNDSVTETGTFKKSSDKEESTPTVAQDAVSNGTDADDLPF